MVHSRFLFSYQHIGGRSSQTVVIVTLRDVRIGCCVPRSDPTRSNSFLAAVSNRVVCERGHAQRISGRAVRGCDPRTVDVVIQAAEVVEVFEVPVEALLQAV
jgi:hypothetical protein